VRTVAELRLRRHCRRLLRELDLRPPLDVTDMCERLSRYRGRPILLAEHPIPVPGPFGVWLSTSRADHIFYQRETTRPHQVHIIVHEIGHLIADHRSDEQDDDLLQLIYPDLAPEAVRRALRRTSYDTAQEREAETVATIILQWASVLDAVTPRLSASRGGQSTQDALGDRMGWL
jgi:hypothetical protein